MSTNVKWTQETLEEALNRFKKEHTVLNLYPSNILKNIAEFGAKWQQEQINFDLPELLERYNELERCKKEASAVFSQINFQELGGLLNIELGTSVSEQLQTKVVELLEQRNKAVDILRVLNSSALFSVDFPSSKEVIEQFLKTLEK